MKFAATDWLIGALLFSASIALFARTVGFAYIYYDDPDYTFRDDHVQRGITPAGAHYAFTTFNLSNWHPLTWLSYMLDVQLFGMTPRAFHRTNVLLHACNGVALFLLLRAMTGSRWRSAFAATVFALHPLRVESVAWIAERKDVLSVFFGLLTLLAYVRYARSGNRNAYLISAILFVLCLLSKPMLVTLPIVMLLIDRWPLDRFSGAGVRRLLVEKSPLFALSALSAIMTLRAASDFGAVHGVAKVPLDARLANAIDSYARYLLDMIWPAKLVVLYPFDGRISVDAMMAALVVLTLISSAALYFRRRAPQLLVGWLWYLITLLPVIGIVAVGEQSRADRYTYFPMIGIILMVIWSIPNPTTAMQRNVMSAVATGVLIAIAINTWRQLQHWRDSEALFTRTLAVIGPHPTMHLALAAAFAEAGRWSEASEQFRAAGVLKPNSPAVLMGLGNALYAQNRYDESLEYFRKALRLAPNDPIGWMNLGLAFTQLERYPDAERAFRQSLQLRPGFIPAMQNLNEVLQRQGKPQE